MHCLLFYTHAVYDNLLFQVHFYGIHKCAEWVVSLYHTYIDNMWVMLPHFFTITKLSLSAKIVIILPIRRLITIVCDQPIILRSHIVGFHVQDHIL